MFYVIYFCNGNAEIILCWFGAQETFIVIINSRAA